MLFTIIKHNAFVFYIMFKLEFFKFFDNIEQKIFVLRKKGSIGNYYSKKLISAAASDNFKRIDKFIFAKLILSKFYRDETNLFYYSSFFHELTLLQYLTDYKLIVKLKKASVVFTPKEILDCMVELNMVSKNNLINMFGQEKYNFYLKCTLKEAIDSFKEKTSIKVNYHDSHLI